MPVKCEMAADVLLFFDYTTAGVNKQEKAAMQAPSVVRSGSPVLVADIDIHSSFWCAHATYGLPHPQCKPHACLRLRGIGSTSLYNKVRYVSKVTYPPGYAIDAWFSFITMRYPVGRSFNRIHNLRIECRFPACLLSNAPLIRFAKQMSGAFLLFYIAQLSTAASSDQVYAGSQLPCASIRSSHRLTISSMDSSAAVCGSIIAAR